MSNLIKKAIFIIGIIALLFGAFVAYRFVSVVSDANACFTGSGWGSGICPWLEPTPVPTPAPECPQAACYEPCNPEGEPGCQGGLACETLPCPDGEACAEYFVCLNLDCPSEEGCACREGTVPTPSPRPGPAPTKEQGDTTCHTCPGTAPSCDDRVPGHVPHALAVPSVFGDYCQPIRWWEPEGAERVHFMYSETPGEWRYGLLNVPNDGSDEICNLADKTCYYFTMAGVNGCAVGEWSEVFTNCGFYP